jgi:hypothetical protein
MSRYRKLLLDHDMADGHSAAFEHFSAPVTVIKSREVLNHEAAAKDEEILREGKARNAYVVTADRGYKDHKLYPCRSSDYAPRSIVELPLADTNEMASHLLKAWRTVTWKRVTLHPLLIVQEHQATLYDCDGDVPGPVTPVYRLQ